eukprot:TRINITY_DN2812_c0_g1_i1.p1 TRINITY_DN2812_c0_g1~~TRINITY_DN2812_c0_g1_i1.p1  ORF type:complete len:122 (-),score=14.68 TRINITY_DN2812_c0_g1_i1:4-369(-)
MPVTADTDAIIPDDQDLIYEEDVLRNPYFLKSWLRYLEFKQGSPAKVRNLIYERALRELPGSYKLWHAYLHERVQNVRGKCVTDAAFESCNNVFESTCIHAQDAENLVRLLSVLDGSSKDN